VIFWARRGQGKSLSMVGISKILAPGFKKAGWQIKSNIQISFADFCHPLLGSLISNDLYKAERSLLDIDEITELIPSRRSMSRVNVNSLSVMRQIRKLRCEVMCTTQFPTDVDKNMLKQLDLWVLCVGHFPKDSRWNPYSAQRAYIDLWVFDLWGQFSGFGLQKNLFPPPLNMAIKKIVLRNLPGAWHDYNTYDLVASEHSSEQARERLVTRQWDTEQVIADEQRAEDEARTPEMRDWDGIVDGRLAEQAASKQEPPPETVISLARSPQTLAEWIERKRTASRFPLSNVTIREIHPFAPEVTTLKQVFGILENASFEITKNKDGRYYAEAI